MGLSHIAILGTNPVSMMVQTSLFEMLAHGNALTDPIKFPTLKLGTCGNHVSGLLFAGWGLER